MFGRKIEVTTRDISAGSTKTIGAVDQRFLARRITDVEHSLGDGSWVHRDFSAVDKVMMPHLVAMANKKKEGLNLAYVPAPRTLTNEMTVFFCGNRESKRYIVNMGEEGTHFAVLDVRSVDGKISALLFEPTTLRNSSPALLSLRTRLAIERAGIPDSKVAAVEMDIQKSHAECGIFSLGLAKKLHRERDRVLSMHASNALGRLGQVVSSDEAYERLPPNFFKHSQGVIRFGDYSSATIPPSDSIVNKRGQNLIERQIERLENVNGRTLSKSIHFKRLAEYKSLLGHLRTDLPAV